MKKLLLLLLCVPLIGFGQSNKDDIMIAPNCQDIKGLLFSELKWTKIEPLQPIIPYGYNGIIRMCNEDGKVEWQFSWKDGKNNGPERWFYNNGNLENEVIWEMGKIVSSRCYKEDGSVKECNEWMVPK